ncbi:MAG: hypothetical protein ACOY4Q_11390 [Bacillota bacterium]
MKNKVIAGTLAVALVVLGGWVWHSVSEIKARQAKLNFAQEGASAESFIRRSDGGGVTVDVVLLNAAGRAPEGEVAFEIALNTHSVPLENYDVTKNAVIRTSDGGSSDKGFTWDSGSDASHHRSGVLRIKADDLIGSGTKGITLELRNLAGVAVREFKWDLPK